MSFEHASSGAENGEELTPLERFERLLELMETAAGSESGSMELPKTTLRIGRRTIPVKFSIFVPKPIPEYSSRYNPSIILEVGHREPEPETGKLIGKIEQTYVRRDYLDETSNYYDRYHQQAEADLGRIETMFYAYRNTIESLKPSE